MSKKMSVLLWTIQGLLAALFLFAGVMKLITPTATLAQQSKMSGEFIKFIGVCETLGALGLVLPGIFKVRPELTPLAAAGLVIIMIGAVVVTLMHGFGVANAVLPAVVGVLCAVVLYFRSRRPVVATAA